MYASDFNAVPTSQTYINKAPTDIIDFIILPPANNGTFLRILEDETEEKVFADVSTLGLFDTWTRPGGKVSDYPV
jgi:hypothetical protein